MVGRGTVTGAAIPALWCLRGRYAQGCGRSHPAGGVKSLEAEGFGDRRKRSRARAANQFRSAKTAGSVFGESQFHGHPAASESRWHATSPAHPLAVTVHERIDPEAFLQGCCPPESSRLPGGGLVQCPFSDPSRRAQTEMTCAATLMSTQTRYYDETLLTADHGCPKEFGQPDGIIDRRALEIASAAKPYPSGL